MHYTWFRVLFVSIIAVLLGACVQTTYTPMNRITEQGSLFERRVAFRLTDAFYDTAPDCTAIMTTGKRRIGVSDALEEAVERHLVTRLLRVIGTSQLRLVETQLGIDMKTKADRRVFYRQARCETVVEIELIEMQDVYLVLWAQRGLSLRLTMTRVSDEKLLWEARHTAVRADGGLPISIIDLPLSAARAVWVNRDPEMFASIAEDAVRRMMRTLPSLRGVSRPMNTARSSGVGW